MNHTLANITAVAILLLVAAACKQEGPQGEELDPVSVEVQRARWIEIPQVFRFPGTVEGIRTVQLSTKTLGRISFLRVKEGGRVHRGDVLLRVQADDVEAQREQAAASLREARSSFQNAERDYRRMKALYESESATQKELDDAAMRHEVAQARIAALEGRLREIDDVLSYAVLTAPSDGVVVAKFAEEGDMASPGVPLLVVEDASALEAVVQVPESEIRRFATGDTVGVEVDALGGLVTTGVVVQVNPSGDAATRQFEVRVAVSGDGRAAGVKSGMYARVVLQKGIRRVIAVHDSVLHRRGQLTGLFTVDSDGRALLRWVRTGKRFNDRTEILAGLSEGEVYVTSNDGRLMDGQRVRVLD